jgi:hypothetical protein
MLSLPSDQKSHYFLPKEQVDEAASLFAEAEKCIKDIEHNGEGLDIPSINELRYFGWHLLKALTQNNLEELVKAKNHAKRAIFDACEAQIVANLTSIENFENDYRVINVSEVIKDYSELMVQAENAKNFIQDHDGESREDYYRNCVDHVEILKNINKKFKAARHDLNVKRNDKATTTLRYFVTIGTTLTVALIAATVAFLTKRP